METASSAICGNSFQDKGDFFMENAQSSTGKLDQFSEEMLKLFSHGGTLGDLYEFTDEEYEAVYQLGFNTYNQGRYLDALKLFAFLVIHNTYQRKYVFAYASCFQMLKQYKEAIQYYSLASAMDLKDPVPTFHTAECMIATGYFKQAREALEIVITQTKKQQPKFDELQQRAELMLGFLDSKQQ